MEEFDLTKALDELFKPTESTLTNTSEAPAGATLTSATEESNRGDLHEQAEAPNGATLASMTEAPNEATLADANQAPAEWTLANSNAPTEAILTKMTEAPNPISLESILSRLSPEGQAWLNGLNRFCRRAVEHDLRSAGPSLFVRHWEFLRDTLRRLERDLGPSDNWM
jgi:hypothetical protein